MNTDEYTEVYIKAQKGDPEAMFILGKHSESENNGGESLWLAERMYRKAAGLGHAGAAAALGDMLSANGFRYLAADMWFVAAQKGDAGAMMKLSGLFAEEGLDDLAEEYSARAADAKTGNE